MNEHNFITEKDVREKRFVEHKESGEHMIHRLRDWEEDDIVWGWDLIPETGKSWTGKTFARAERYDVLEDEHFKATPHKEAQEVLDNPPSMARSGVIFVWAARIETIRTEASDPSDPGEPPLKYATFYDVMVWDSKRLS